MAIIKKEESFNKLYAQIVTFSGDIFRMDMGVKETVTIIAESLDDFDGYSSYAEIASGTEIIAGVDKVFYTKTFVKAYEKSGSGSGSSSGTGDGDLPTLKKESDTFLVKTYDNYTKLYPEITLPTLDNGIQLFRRTIVPTRTTQYKETHRTKHNFSGSGYGLPTNPNENYAAIKKIESTNNVLTYSL